MTIFLLLLFITGLSLLLLIQPKTKLSNLILFPLLLGISYHTILFLVLAYGQVYYSKQLFIISSLIIIFVNIVYLLLKHKKIKVENNLRDIPIYYLLFLLYIVIRFVIIAKSTFVNFNNWDELRFYQYVSKEIFMTHNVNYIYELLATMTYFLGTMTYEFCGTLVNNSRIFGGIFYGIMSLFIYSELRGFKVNRHISALLSILFLLSSAETFLYYITFYNNVYYAVFLLIGMYLLLKSMLVQEEKSTSCLAYIFLLASCLIRRESIYHVIAVIILLYGYLFIRKRKNIKQLVLSVFPFFTILVTWNIFSKLNKIENTIKSYSVVSSYLERLMDRFNLPGLSSFFRSALEAMFGTGRFSANYVIFGISCLALILCIIKFLKRDKRNLPIEFLVFQILQQILYFGIILLTALFLFTESEYLSAASFSRYMLMVTPISFITLGIILFKDTDMEEERLLHKRSKLTKYKTLLIIPAYNEEENILTTYQKIQNYNKKNKTNYEVIVINDGSKDNTKEILEENNIPHINLIQNLGIGGAVQTGYKYALKNNYDIAVQFDGDGQHDIEYVKDLITPIINGEVDMVIGSRFIHPEQQNFKSTWIRRVGITLISFTIKLTTGRKVYDTTSGYRACNKELIEIFSKKYPLEYPEPITEVRLLKDGYTIKEVYAKMHERKAGQSSITKKIWSPLYYMFNVILSILIEGMVKTNDR